MADEKTEYTNYELTRMLKRMEKAATEHDKAETMRLNSIYSPMLDQVQGQGQYESGSLPDKYNQARNFFLNQFWPDSYLSPEKKKIELEKAHKIIEELPDKK